MYASSFPKATLTHLQPMFHHWFSDVFRGYRSQLLVENGLNSRYSSQKLQIMRIKVIRSFLKH